MWGSTVSLALLVIDMPQQWEALSPIASLATVIITPASATRKRVDAFVNTTLQGRIASTVHGDSTETLWQVSDYYTGLFSIQGGPPRSVMEKP